MSDINTGNVWLEVDQSQSEGGAGKGAGLGREAGSGGQGPFWVSGAVLVVRSRFVGEGVNDYIFSYGFLLSLFPIPLYYWL